MHLLPKFQVRQPVSDPAEILVELYPRHTCEIGIDEPVEAAIGKQKCQEGITALRVGQGHQVLKK